MLMEYTFADLEVWQLPVVVLEFLILLGAIIGGMYLLVKWTGKK
jgi:hypothetical protein